VTLRRPAAVLRFDGRDLALDESAAAAVTVELTTTGGHDRATIVLGPGSPVLDVAAAAAIEIELGDDGGTVACFAGTVAQVLHRPWGTVVEALSATFALDGLRVGRVYVGRTIGDIVSDLASAARVTPGEIDASTNLTVFHADEARTAWRHVRGLAALCGAELTSGERGEINLRPPRTGAADHTMRGGADLLEWAVGARPQPLASAPAGPFSAASEQGSDAWSLVHHDPGGGGFRSVMPTVRDRDLAQLVDDGRAAGQRRAGRRGRLVVVGDASIRAGHLVELDAAGVDPVDRATGTYRAVTVRHEIDRGGFRTELWIEAA